MGQSLSKMRPEARHSVKNPGTGATQIEHGDQDALHAKGKGLQNHEAPDQADESEPSGNRSPESNAPMEDHDTSTCIVTESSPTTSYSQHRLGKARKLSEISSKPRLRWPPGIHHPETNVEVFRWEMSGEKRALRILCSDLCKGLSQLAAESPGAWTEFSENIVVEPYELIFHNKARIKQDKTAQLGTGNWKKHLLFLVTCLEKESPEAWDRFDAIEAGRCNTATFDTVPLLYRPGDTVLQNDDGAWRAYVIERREHRRSGNTELMLIHARYLDFNKTGNSLVPHATVFELQKFDTEQPINDLELIPRKFLGKEFDLIGSIKDRGTEYFKYRAEAWYCEYHGDEWPGPSQKEPLRVIIDYVTSSKHSRASITSDVKRNGGSCSICAGKSIGLAPFPGYVDHDSLLCKTVERAGTQHQHGRRMVQGDYPFLFCPPKLWAFSLHHKSWRMVSPHDLSEVPRRDEPFDEDLCMENRKKEYFKSIALEYMDILQQGKSSESLAQKRRGLNVLLCGNTGVGKTFTAECLSAKYGLPLYTMTCGDLGDDPELFDLRLHETFLRGINWGAIILLDEVDEYVYSRNRYNTRRSYLTPILLRHLETSESLTILTMTHTEETERAFIGYSHFSLRLPDFSPANQRKLWHKAIDSIPFPLGNEHELKDFVDVELQSPAYRTCQNMNARQIQNAVRLATAIARGHGEDSSVSRLDAEHIRTALTLGREFMGYMLQESKGSQSHQIADQLNVLGGNE